MFEEYLIPPTEEEQQRAFQRAVEALLKRFKRYPSGFSDEEIESIERNCAAWEYPGIQRVVLGLVECSEPEKVDPTPTVICLPHSVDPEERKRIGYPLTPEDEEEISRRLHKRVEQCEEKKAALTAR